MLDIAYVIENSVMESFPKRKLVMFVCVLLRMFCF